VLRFALATHYYPKLVNLVPSTRPPIRIGGGQAGRKSVSSQRGAWLHSYNAQE